MDRVPRRLVLALALVAIAVGLVLLLQGGSLWRAAYPYLPRRVQAAPYQLRALVPGPERTPIALPTAATAVELGGPSDGNAPAATPVPPTPTNAPSPTTSPSPVAGVVDADPIATPSPTAPLPALPPQTALDGLRHEYQTWNNCGPATVSMALSYYGQAEGQAAAAKVLKPDPDDKNVGPDELAAYAREQGLEAPLLVNGDLDRLRRLLALDVPVVVETWFVPEPGDEMGHYRVLTGYDDAAGHFVMHDSYNGPDITLDYETFDRRWRVFNRTYVPVYTPEEAETVEAVLGDDLDETTMYRRAVARAEAEIAAEADAFGWFNLGSSLMALGDADGAAAAYDRARALGLPWRMLWYQFGPFEAYAAVGRWDDVRALAEANLANADNLEESHYWRGRALEAQGDITGARAAWQRAWQLNPNYAAPRDALASEH